MENHSFSKIIGLLAGIILLLLALSWIPAFTVGPLRFKKVDLLADLKPDPPPVAKKKNTLTKKRDTLIVKKSSCPPGKVCIEDYSENKNGLALFFKSLQDSKRKTSRVAFFGDSFIEGDILCSSFRDTLQQIYGGRGVGFVPIASAVATFRTTIQHTYAGWKTYWPVGEKNPASPPGFSGYCYVPLEGNEVTYKPGKRQGGSFRDMRVFFRSTMPSGLQVVHHDTITERSSYPGSDSLKQELVHLDGASSVKLHFEPIDSLKVYGVSFEEPEGVYVDNFAMRGNSGIGLYQIEPADLRAFNEYRRYQLVILQYGLNVVTESDSANYDWYIDRMTRVINRLKENLPGCNFLLVSVSDRCYNQNGNMVTIPNIFLMRDAQREIAKRTKITFWDLLSTMEGNLSMVKLVTATPPLASKDYTHLTFNGGRKLAVKLAAALLHEKKKYDSPTVHIP